VHIGGNAYHGHYVSIIKTQDRGWLLFDDEMVEPVDKHYVRNFFGDKPGMACAYVLFYQETTLEAVQKEQEAEGLAEVALASQEAGIALGHPQSNGTHPSPVSKQVSIPNTPVDENDGFASLDHAMTAPVPKSPPIGVPRNAPIQMANTNLPTTEAKKANSKAEKEREKKEQKEAEKARKAAEKEKVKADEKLRKEQEAKRKEYQKTQADQVKAALAASKQSAAEDEDKRRKEAVPTGIVNEKKDNGLVGGLSLSRSNKGSKSMSRKSFGWLKSGEGSKEGNDTAIAEGDAMPQTPEKSAKDRFSFSIGRKKSNLNIS
jgi:ubiquitin carboxyl-terminal hydrolase 9/13